MKFVTLQAGGFYSSCLVLLCLLGFCGLCPSSSSLVWPCSHCVLRTVCCSSSTRLSTCTSSPRHLSWYLGPVFSSVSVELLVLPARCVTVTQAQKRRKLKLDFGEVWFRFCRWSDWMNLSGLNLLCRCFCHHVAENLSADCRAADRSSYSTSWPHCVFHPRYHLAHQC